MKHYTLNPKTMECNVGMTEQKLRVLAGLALIGVGAYYNMKGLAAVGFVPIITGALRYCPINQALGYNGCQPKHTVQRAIL